ALHRPVFTSKLLDLRQTCQCRTGLTCELPDPFEVFLGQRWRIHRRNQRNGAIKIAVADYWENQNARANGCYRAWRLRMIDMADSDEFSLRELFKQCGMSLKMCLQP